MVRNDLGCLYVGSSLTRLPGIDQGCANSIFRPHAAGRSLACGQQATRRKSGFVAGRPPADGRCCATGGPTPQCLHSDTACRRQPLGAVLAPGEN